jgi:hypothetical protein
MNTRFGLVCKQMLAKPSKPKFVQMINIENSKQNLLKKIKQAVR